MPIGTSELILNEDGTIFHLHLLPEELADTVILVGDQNRVSNVSNYFDEITVKKQNREFITHTGIYRGRPISVVSTGIGTDNIDIVLNELDALANIDFATREIKTSHKTLQLIRIGTSGALQNDIESNTPVVSVISAGFDGMINYYADRNKVALLDLEEEFKQHVNWHPQWAAPYFVEASKQLTEMIGFDMRKGITITAPGFYGPQGRELRLPLAAPKLNDLLPSFEYKGLQVTNYEMESAAIFGLAKLLGHEAATVCNIIANRQNKKFGGDYNKAMLQLIKTVIDRLFPL